MRIGATGLAVTRDLARDRLRLLRQYLLFTSLFYAIGVGTTFEPNKTVATGNITGGLIAVALGIVALIMIRPGTEPSRRAEIAAIAQAMAATPIVMAFHVLLVAQVLTDIAAIFLAMYLWAFFTPRLARLLTVLLAVMVVAAVAVSPASATWFTYVLLAASVILAGEMFGSVLRALIRTATTDPLTGVLNRAGLELATAEISARAGNRHIAAIVADVDDFKSVNDTCGHQAGDRLLIELAQHLVESLPKDTVIARIGGDEFIVIVDDCDAQSACTLVRTLEESSQVAISCGFAATPAFSFDFSDLYRLADAELYRVKSSRRPPAGEDDRAVQP